MEPYLGILDKYQIECFYHFTSKRNLESIVHHNGLFAKSFHAESGIECEYCTNEQSWNLDAQRGLDSYVHLSFVREHNLIHDARKRLGVDGVAVIGIRPEVLIFHGVRFAPDIANSTGVSIYPIECIEGKIDLGIIYNENNVTRSVPSWDPRNTRRAELLIPQRIPLSFIIDWR